MLPTCLFMNTGCNNSAVDFNICIEKESSSIFLFVCSFIHSEEIKAIENQFVHSMPTRKMTGLPLLLKMVP